MTGTKQGHVDFLELHILHHAAEEPLYGLWMIGELAHHGYRVGASHLYPKFHRLEREGYLKREDRLVEGKLRKYYRATLKGTRYLNARKRMVLELVREAFSAEDLESILNEKKQGHATKGREGQESRPQTRKVGKGKLP